MKVHVLQVSAKEADRAELRAAVADGRTNESGWQMPEKAEVGDLVIWYASGYQKFVARGWVEEPPKRYVTGHGPFRGPVAGIRELQPWVDRRQVLAECEVNGGLRRYQTVKGEKTIPFLRSLGLFA